MQNFPLVILLLTGLVACDAAGPGYYGVPKVRQIVDGTTFTLRFRGGIAEAIRISPEVLPRFPDVAQKAAIATHRHSGCMPKWVMGDPALMWVGLSCNGAKAPAMPRKPKTLYCDVLDLYQSGGLVRGGLECT
jgi:hypothetical protein